MTRGEALLAWYAEHHRDLPWRRTTDPYRILVSEVMLQQTQVSRVVPAYSAFLELFPTPASLADATLDEVLLAWQGLGYPVRARRLREAARIVTDEGWPPTDALDTLPGVGPYTAAALASFAFGEHIAAVDTNVRRVVSRWVGRPLSGRTLDTAADHEITRTAATWNQAIMELGALICRPTPHCDDCPVRSHCADPSIYVAPPRQAGYRGSLRQVRGDLIRALQAAGGSDSADRLTDVSGHPSERVDTALESLRADGLVRMDTGIVSIAT